MKLEATPQSKAHARVLRAGMSLPEVALWEALRRKGQGARWRRQHPAGSFVADFYCYAAALVVEVDGEAHDRGDAPARDAARDGWFSAQGIDVLRIPAREVLDNLEGVLLFINEAVARRAPSVGFAATSPRGGGLAINPPPRGEVARRRRDGGGQ